MKSRGMLDLMIEMAELLERLAKGERVAPEEARSIKGVPAGATRGHAQSTGWRERRRVTCDTPITGVLVPPRGSLRREAHRVTLAVVKIRHKGLLALHERDDSARLPAGQVSRLRRILFRLQEASSRATRPGQASGCIP